MYSVSKIQVLPCFLLVVGRNSRQWMRKANGTSNPGQSGLLGCWTNIYRAGTMWHALWQVLMAMGQEPSHHGVFHNGEPRYNRYQETSVPFHVLFWVTLICYIITVPRFLNFKIWKAMSFLMIKYIWIMWNCFKLLLEKALFGKSWDVSQEIL